MNGKAERFTSDEIKELAQKAKILDLHNHKSIEQKYREIIRAADKEARLLKREELTTLSQKSKINIQIVESVQDHADVLVEGAKQKLLEGNPELVEPGGALFPAERANSCWRDCKHFFRLCCYAWAVGEPELTNEQGMKALGKLYKALSVPVPELLCALNELKESTIEYCRSLVVGGESVAQCTQVLAQAFDILGRDLRQGLETTR